MHRHLIGRDGENILLLKTYHYHFRINGTSMFISISCFIMYPLSHIVRQKCIYFVA